MKSIVRKAACLLLQVFPKFGLKYRINHLLKNAYSIKDYNGMLFGKDVDDNLKSFLSASELKNKEYVDWLEHDLAKMYLLYGITPDEYFLHSLQKESEVYKSTILSREYKDELCMKYLGKDTQEYYNQLKDKWQFYLLAKPFFKRDVCRVEEESDFASVEEFCSKHTRFIAKPRLASSGLGVHIVDLENIESGGARKIFEHYRSLDNGKWMFEELIEQDECMAAWHPSSVNTIRIPSIKTKHGFKVLLPLFRTGKNGNLVDNCHNDGGLMAVPDAKTGILISDGYDIYTNIVEKHPNSGMKFKGWQVPLWEDLLKTASDLHQSLPPKHKYIGFDFALTPKGWVVVEGNWGNFPHQVCVHHGIRVEFEKLMKS